MRTIARRPPKARPKTTARPKATARRSAAAGLLPRSGSEPTNYGYYQEKRSIIRNNCMAFAFGEKGRTNYQKQQPGNKTPAMKGTNFSLATCDELVRRVLSDYKGSVYKGTPARSCRRGYAKVMAFLAPGADFHFYRQGPDGFWEHKRGLTPPTRVDARGKPIVDPSKANRDYGQGYDYSVKCSTFCRRNDVETARTKSLKARAVIQMRKHRRPA